MPNNSWLGSRVTNAVNTLPGLALCTAIAVAAGLAQQLEVTLLRSPFVESLVLAIVIGTIIRSTLTLPPRLTPGIAFAATTVLEVAVCLLGVSVDLGVMVRAGPLLLGGIVVIVAASLALSYSAARLCKLNHRLSILIACGNSICGNSAIAAVGPVIDAEPGDMASAIGFTGLLGVVLVLVLPALARASWISPAQYGVVAGLTVYAVPQVLAATLPVGALAVTVGTLVKLVRVLLLGPTVFGIALFNPARRAGQRIALAKAIPWFIVGFLALAALRSAGMVPAAVLPITHDAVGLLTVVAMGALGLGVDVRALRKVGPRVVTAVSLSLAMLFGMSLTLALALRQMSAIQR